MCSPSFFISENVKCNWYHNTCRHNWCSYTFLYILGVLSSALRKEGKCLNELNLGNKESLPFIQIVLLSEVHNDWSQNSEMCYIPSFLLLSLFVSSMKQNTKQLILKHKVEKTFYPYKAKLHFYIILKWKFKQVNYFEVV